MKKYRMLIIGLILLIALSLYNIDLGWTAIQSSASQFMTMLLIVPPIFLLIGLLDVWIPRETMIQLMGKKSGIKGVLIAFTFGTLAAGPLVAAFPVAMVMLKKGARYANVLFFLMIWASTKLPILFFQVSTLGVKFTLVINLTLIVVYLIGAFFLERFFSEKELDALYEKAKNY